VEVQSQERYDFLYVSRNIWHPNEGVTVDPERHSDATSLQGKILRCIRLTSFVFQLVAFWPVSSALMLGQDPPSASVRVASVSTLEALITDEGTDGDNNITIDDPRVTETSRGDRRFTLRAPDGRPFVTCLHSPRSFRTLPLVPISDTFDQHSSTLTIYYE
jgi:hypothetical protein